MTRAFVAVRLARRRCSTRLRGTGRGASRFRGRRDDAATSGTSRCSSSATTPTSTRSSRARRHRRCRAARVRLGGAGAFPDARRGARAVARVRRGRATCSRDSPTPSPSAPAPLGYERDDAAVPSAPHARALPASDRRCAALIAAIGDEPVGPAWDGRRGHACTRASAAPTARATSSGRRSRCRVTATGVSGRAPDRAGPRS